MIQYEIYFEDRFHIFYQQVEYYLGMLRLISPDHMSNRNLNFKFGVMQDGRIGGP